MCFGGNPKVDTSYQDFQKAEAERARIKEQGRQTRVADGMSSISDVFGSLAPVLDQRGQAQQDYYLPQLDQKYSKARDQLTFALSRAGLLNSTAAGEKQANLSEMFALNRGKIMANINSDVAGTRTRMNQNRASIEAALRASSDTSAASEAALSSAVTFRQDQPRLDPLGNIFYGISSGIGSARQGYDTGRIRRLATPNPLGRGFSRNVGG